MGWLSASNPVAWWWAILSGFACLNLVTFVFVARHIEARELTPDERRRLRTVLLLAFLFTLGCASRSIVPRADVERYVLWDFWFSNVFVGRSIATIAELAFAIEGSMVLFFVSKQLGFSPGQWVGRTIPILIFTAECFSWYAVISTHFFGNAIEESLWATSYALAAIALLGLARRARGRLSKLVLAAGIGSLIYVAFMVLHDVPMYVSRLAADTAAGKQFLSLSAGVNDLLTRWVVTRSFEHWGPEMPWMSLYFTVCVWAALALCFAPLTSKDVDRLQA